MSMHRKHILKSGMHILFVCVMVHSIQAQDLHFSQFHEAPLLRNPALAGLFEGDVRIQGVYRNQWNSLSYPFQTGSINGEYKFYSGRGEDYITVGGQVLYDKAGSLQLQTVHVLPNVTFHKSLSQARNTYLSVGFMGGLVNRNLTRSRVTTNNQYDGFNYNGTLPDGEVFSGSYSYADMAVGLSFNTSLGANEQHVIFGGVAVHHFNKPINSFYKNITHLPKYVFSGGLKLNIDEYTYSTFHVDFIRQYPFHQAVGGGIFSKRIGDAGEPAYTVHAGMFYRYADALIPLLKFDVNALSIGLSYDINISTLTPASRNRGGFEISMTYMASRLRQERPVHCPRF